METLIYYIYTLAQNKTRNLFKDNEKTSNLINLNNLTYHLNSTIVNNGITNYSNYSLLSTTSEKHITRFPYIITSTPSATAVTFNSVASAINISNAADDSNGAYVLQILIVVLYSILIFISLTSNPLLIYVLLIKRKTQLKLIDVFVINLSISDFLLTIFNIPLCLTIFFSGKWLFGTFICKLGTYSTSSAIYINILTMAYISVDRYFAITSPLISNHRNTNLRINAVNFDYATKRKIYIALAVIWFIALIISIPQFIFTKISKIEADILNTNDYESLANSLMGSSTSSSINSIDQNFLNNFHNFTDFKTKSLSGDYTDVNISGDEGQFDDYFIRSTTPSDESLAEEILLMNKKFDVHFSKFGEGLMTRCTLDYPLLNMKSAMVLVNFLLQYLLPSLVIILFYGKIIYHLYLNLNIEILYPTFEGSHHHNHSSNGSFEFKTTNKETSKHKSICNKLMQLRKFGKKKASLTSTTMSNMTKQSLTSQKQQQQQPEQQQQAYTQSLDDIPMRRRSQSSLMRAEGLTRTNNLKKSIKIMIIIITSFLLSWMPIHLYRLVTTFHPYTKNSRQNNLNLIDNVNNCTIENFIQCLFLNENTHSTSNANLNVNIGKSGSGGGNSDGGELNSSYTHSLHNRYLFFFFHFLSMSSVCYNPIVYFWLHKKFRKEVKQMLGKICTLFIFMRNNTINKLRKGCKSASFTVTPVGVEKSLADDCTVANDVGGVKIIKNGNNTCVVHKKQLIANTNGYMVKVNLNSEIKTTSKKCCIVKRISSKLTRVTSSTSGSGSSSFI